MIKSEKKFITESAVGDFTEASQHETMFNTLHYVKRLVTECMMCISNSVYCKK